MVEDKFGQKISLKQLHNMQPKIRKNDNNIETLSTVVDLLRNKFSKS